MSHRASQSEICLSHRSALQALAFRTRCGESLSPSRRRSFPSGTLRAESLPRLPVDAAINAASAIALPVHTITSDPVFQRKTTFRHPHGCAQALHGGALLRWDDTVFVSAPPLAFVQEATLLPFIDLITLGFEICGTYQQVTANGPTLYNTRPLTSVREIRNFIGLNPSLHGTAKARRALQYLANGSASPRETKAALLLGLPASYGGYGLGIPSMNYEIGCTPEARAIASRRTLRCDLFWPNARIAVEYQSREFHSDDRQRIRDSRRVNALQAMGITVIAMTNDELDSIAATDVIANTARKALGRRSRVTTKNYHSRKLTLRRQLGLPVWSRETFETTSQ